MDEFIEEMVDDATDTAERLAKSAENLWNTGFDSFTHSARGLEENVDADHDGSLLDDIAGGAVGAIPIVGDIFGGSLAATAEELGDFATDTMGTRKHGLFNEKGTLDRDLTTDSDYAIDGKFDGGFGQAINDTLGIGDDTDPAKALMLAGAVTTPIGGIGLVQLGLAAEAVQDRDDPHDTTQFGPTNEPSVGPKPDGGKPSVSDKPPDATKPTEVGTPIK